MPNCCSLHTLRVSDLRRQPVGQVRVAAMVLIHNVDSDEEQLQIVSHKEPEAYAATSHSENRMGIKMTPKVPPQFDGQSSWFEYEDLIDDWSGITTLDADKHGPSVKNALIGSASFYKSMLDNALLRDPDRGPAHFKDTLRPYFVKGVNHVFLWRFLQMFRTYRGQNEFVHWIGRFEIAQKRLLASWSDLLDISDLPDAGTPAFTAALTDEQRLHYNQIAADEDKRTVPAQTQDLKKKTSCDSRQSREETNPHSNLVHPSNPHGSPVVHCLLFFFACLDPKSMKNGPYKGIPF